MWKSQLAVVICIALAMNVSWAAEKAPSRPAAGAESIGREAEARRLTVQLLSRDEASRVAAASKLQAIGMDAFPAVIEEVAALEDGKITFRKAALELCIKLPRDPEDALKRSQDLLSSPVEKQRLGAAAYLRTVPRKSPEVDQQLRRRLFEAAQQDASDQVRKAAKSSLLSIASRAIDFKFGTVMDMAKAEPEKTKALLPILIAGIAKDLDDLVQLDAEGAEALSMWASLNKEHAHEVRRLLRVFPADAPARLQYELQLTIDDLMLKEVSARLDKLPNAGKAR